MAEPAAVTIDIEGASGQATGPDVFIEDEAASVPSPDGDVPFVDGGSQDLAIALPDSVETFDGVVGQADHFMEDPVGHRREDPFDIAVVFRPQLPVHEPIEVGSLDGIEVLLLHHATHGPAAR
jgi:hypothetical protein